MLSSYGGTRCAASTSLRVAFLMSRKTSLASCSATGMTFRLPSEQPPHQGLVAERAKRTVLVVIAPLRGTFYPCVVQAQEPGGVKAFGPHRPLNTSANALSVGFPGLLKSSTASC